MARFTALAVAALLVLALPGPAAANPFTGKPGPSAEQTGEPSGQSAEIERGWTPIALVGRALLTFQRETNRMIAQRMRAIRDGETSVPLLIGIALAFAYGVVHALGPGHGKVVVASYFLAREAQIGRGLLTGVQIAICHVVSAVVAVALADLLLRQAFGSTATETGGVRLASYGLIGLIGMVMLAQAARRSWLRRQGVEVGNACCDHGHASSDHGRREVGARTEQGALSLGVGMVPCTGSVLIMLYALANDILYAGVLLVTAIAAGMAMTMGALGVLSIVARNVVAARVEGGANGNGRTLAVVSDYGGPLLITLIGAALFWSAW